MLSLSTARKPAPMLAMRGTWGRTGVRPIAFGNALGDSIVAEASRPSYTKEESDADFKRENNRFAAAAERNASAGGSDDAQVAALGIDQVMASEDQLAKQRAHALLRAQMADAAYLVNPNDPTKGYRGTLPSGVNGVVPGEGVLSAFAPDQFENRETGFAARVFHHAESDTYTVAFRGTDDIRDFVSGNRQAIDPGAPQYKEARRLVERLQLVLGDKLTDLTGHSLGGGLAAATSMMTGLPATTFNAAGLNTSTVTSAGGTWSDERSQALITNYRVKDEVLTSLQERGSIGSIPLAASALFTGPVAGLALQTTAAALPDAAGRQITLDAIDATGTPMSWLQRNNLFKMTPVDLHGMDYVLRGMSAYAKQGHQ
jgi:hypothetical protein